MTVSDQTEPAPEEATEQARPNEAAKYRTRLREAEAQRDALEQQLTNMRGNVLEQHLSASFKSLLQLTGTDASSLFTDDGRFDQEAARSLGETLNEQHPGIIGLAAAPKGWHAYDPDAPEPSLLDLFQQDDSTRHGTRAPFDPDEGRSPATSTSEDGFTGAFAPKQ